MYRWEAAGGRVIVYSNYNRSTYSATVDGQTVGGRFRGMLGAMRAAAKAFNRQEKGSAT